MRSLGPRFGVHAKKTLSLLEARIHGEGALRKLAHRPGVPKPSVVYSLLNPLPVEALLYVMTKTSRETIRKAVSLFITHLRTVRVDVTGRDLLEMGYPRGPVYRTILDAVTTARLDGDVHDLESEKAWILREFPVQGLEDST